MPLDVRFVAPVDQILTTFGLMYMQNRARYFAADQFFPFVEYTGYNGTVYVDEARTTLQADDARAGDEIGYPTISFRGKGIPFMAEDWGFQSLITPKQRMSSQVPGSSIEVRRTRGLTERLWLAREVRTNTLVSAISPNTSLSGTAKWSSTAAVPRTDVMTGKRTVLQYTGREPNKIVLTGTVTDDLITRESAGSAGLSVKTAIQYVMQATGRQINEPLIAAYFDVESVTFWKGVRSASGDFPAPTVESALGVQGSYIGTGDQAYIFYADTPSPETSNYGISPGPMYYGARQVQDPWGRGVWVQCFQALIEFQAEAKSMYVIGTVL